MKFAKFCCVEKYLTTTYMKINDNVWFQKISIPPPQGVIGIARGRGVLKAKIFKGKYEP